MDLNEHLSSADKNISKIILTIAACSVKVRDSFFGGAECAGTQNIYGENQIALDKNADEIIISALKKTGIVRQIASEEQPEAIDVPDATGNYAVTLDPLDGSSCVKTNLAVGTIVGIFNTANVLQPGNKMAAACYVLYGPLTTLVYSTGKGVHEFVMNDKNEFTLRAENLTIGDDKIYAPGGKAKDYLPAHKKWMDDLSAQGYKIRFSGSFVADCNQILHYGGVFTYPGMVGKEGGKLRLLFEGNPLAFIVKNANGASSDGKNSLLDVKPGKLDQRVPIYIGGKKEIELIEKYFKEDK